MSRRRSCQACTFRRMGVKTRIAIPHTCGKTNAQILEEIKKERKNDDKSK